MTKRILTCCLCFSAFFAGLLILSTSIGGWVAEFDEFALREKLEHFERFRDEYDTLFFGSSRVYHQISPALYDQYTRKAGNPTRSFNIALDGLFPPEDSYVAEYIASLRPKNLRWVFVEVSMFLPNTTEKSPESPRSVYWHDWARTSLAVRDILHGTKPFDWKKRQKRWDNWLEGLERSRSHIQMFAWNTTNLGRGTRVLTNFLKNSKPSNAKALGPDRDGYDPLFQRKEAATVELKDYDKLLAERLQLPVLYKSLSPVAQENLDRVLRAVRATGATPVLLVSPVLTRQFFVPRQPMKELYFDFADIHTWPELYRKEVLFDIGHLTKPGAEIYTRYIAERWLAASGAGKSAGTGAIGVATSALDSRPSTP